jgi:hypothetical protein
MGKFGRKLKRESRTPTTITSAVREAIANAVERAVREHVVDPPLVPAHMCCWAYARIGAAITEKITGQPTCVQVGKLEIITGSDAEGPYAAGMIPEGDWFERGEYHAWFALPRATEPQIVDLAARNYRELCEHVASFAGDDRLRWPAEREVPPFIWSVPGALPEWLGLYAQAEPSMSFLQRQDHPDLRGAMDAAFKYARESLAGFR